MTMLLLPATLFAQDIGSIGSAPPLTLSGSLGATVSGYGAAGIDPRQQSGSWTLNGSGNVDLYGVNMPFSFVLSERDRDFRQPFNQFGISPRYKWATLHLGYRSMHISRYTLAGRTFLGAGLELTPGPLRGSIMYGRMERAVEEDTTRGGVLPSYHRNGFAMKLGVGNNSSYFDLSYLRAKDDSNSLQRIPTETSVTPSENAVLAMSAKVAILPQLSLDAEGAASIFTRDLRSPLVDLQDEVPEFLTDFFEVNASTTFAVATKAGLAFKMPDYGIRLGYERIDPGFTTLGSDYFNTDIETWTIAPNVKLLDRKLRLSGSIGIQRDNLLNLKLASTNRLIGSGNISWSPDQKYGVDASYTNYSTGQSAGRRAINDTIAVRNVTQSLSLSPRMTLSSEEKSQVYSLQVGYQDFTDLNAFNGDITDNSSINASASYNLSIVKSGLNGGASLLYAETSFSSGSSTLLGLNVNGSIGLLEDRILSLGGSLGVSTSAVSGSTTTNSVILNESINAGYRMTDKDQFTLTIYSTQTTGDNGFAEVNARLGYGRSFSWTPWQPTPDTETVPSP